MDLVPLACEDEGYGDTMLFEFWGYFRDIFQIIKGIWDTGTPPFQGLSNSWGGDPYQCS